jgi:hypothetical protein
MDECSRGPSVRSPLEALVESRWRTPYQDRSVQVQALYLDYHVPAATVKNYVPRS